MRRTAGAVLHELPRALWGLRPGPRRRAPWVRIRNRRESLEDGPDGLGARCLWRWTSALNAPRALPGLARLLLRRALRDWPIALTDTPDAPHGPPDVTFVLGHRGPARLPALLATLRTIAAQRGATVEAVVVEQSLRPEIPSQLPQWVRYLHTPMPDPDYPYNRSWAMNVGAGLARGELLVLHDNDMLVPSEYAAQLLSHYRQGFEVMNLKRFVFYLKPDSPRPSPGTRFLAQGHPGEVIQNLEGGGSIAVSASAFASLGGLDEAFVGWGGEDVEFWERAAVRRVWPWGYLPIVHLWHEPQPGRSTRTQAIAHHEHLSSTPLEQRIAVLRSKARGRPSEPHTD